MDTNPLILHIETSSGFCSVALSRGEELLAEIVSQKVNSSADELNLLIQQLCSTANIALRELHAVSVSGGPGSYTGLRIGASSAKGIAYALQIPLIHIETFQAMKVELEKKVKYNYDYYIPMIDARRMDAFISVLTIVGEYVENPQCVTIDINSFEIYARVGKVIIFGNNISRFRPILEKDGITFIDDVILTASSMISIANVKFCKKEFENIAYYEPKYYKSFHSSIK